MKKVIRGVFAIAIILLITLPLVIYKQNREIIVVDKMKLKSDAFESRGKIPKKYTCDGENISLPLSVSEVPENAESMTLIMYDPDIPEVFKKQRGIEVWD